MKKNILIILLLAVSINIQALNLDRESLVSWEHFKELVSDLNIPGFSTRTQFEHDDMDGFEAVYMQGGSKRLI